MHPQLVAAPVSGFNDSKLTMGLGSGARASLPMVLRLPASLAHRCIYPAAEFDIPRHKPAVRRAGSATAGTMADGLIGFWDELLRIFR